MRRQSDATRRRKAKAHLTQLYFHCESSHIHLMPSHTVISAPGKVLLAGGYLVLDRQYRGLVISTSSRFYCIVSPSTSPLSSDDRTARIIVKAGQFPSDSSLWGYTISSTPNGIDLKADEGGKNKFVEITLRNALRVVAERRAAEKGIQSAAEELVSSVRESGGLEVVVLAHNDFYSQREAVSFISSFLSDSILAPPAAFIHLFPLNCSESLAARSTALLSPS